MMGMMQLLEVMAPVQRGQYNAEMFVMMHMWVKKVNILHILDMARSLSNQ
jgi:hypothetical protein